VHARSGAEGLIIQREDAHRDVAGDKLTVSIRAARALLFDSAGARIR
jgi:lactose/L-arabinose transport system ATP-binding protein